MSRTRDRYSYFGSIYGFLIAINIAKAANYLESGDYNISGRKPDHQMSDRGGQSSRDRFLLLMVNQASDRLHFY